MAPASQNSPDGARYSVVVNESSRVGLVHEDYALLTPENVELRYPVAGVGSRLIAVSIDYTVLLVAEIVISFALAFTGELVRRLFPPTSVNDPIFGAIGYGAVAVIALMVFFGWWGYFMLFELLWNGQSPGKRLLTLRVVRADGQPLGATTSFVRNLLRAIDTFLLLGVLVMLIDRSSRRLGDLAAGSLVVREPGRMSADRLTDVWLPPIPAARVEAFPNAGRLTMQEYLLVRDYFGRRERMPQEGADALAADLARRLATALEIPLRDVGDANDFLATAARAFEYRHPTPE